MIFAIIYFRTQALKGADARRKADIKKIQTAVEEYEKDHDCYPIPTLVSCEPGNGLQPYLNKIPCDPVTNASYYYDYEDSSCPSWYRFYTRLENEQDDAAISGLGPAGAYNYYQGSPNSPVDNGGQQPNGSGGSENGGASPNEDFYGCFNKVCTPIQWDSSRPGPECDPNYQNPTCYGECQASTVNCTSWN